jgi:hypothetical protein
VVGDLYLCVGVTSVSKMWSAPELQKSSYAYAARVKGGLAKISR